MNNGSTKLHAQPPFYWGVSKDNGQNPRIALVSLAPWCRSAGVLAPFGYGLRKLQASLLGDQLIRELDLLVIDASSAEKDDILPQLETFKPDLVGFCTYVWSFPFFLDLAVHLKKRRSELQVVFGGPSARPEMFDLSPYRESAWAVDALAAGNGEETIRLLAQSVALGAPPIERIPGLHIKTGRGWARTATSTQVLDLDAYPTPYELGTAPSGTTAFLETYRGCPIGCAFCQWGDRTTPVHVHSEDYIERELRGILSSSMRNVALVDPALNLNPLAFARLASAATRSKVFEHLPLYCGLYPRRPTDQQMAFLQSAYIGQLTIGVQTLNRTSLQRVGRPVAPPDLDSILTSLRQVAPVAIEIILGLPDDDPYTFRQTLDRSLDLAPVVRVYRCLVLPGGLMTHAARMGITFNPRTLELTACKGWEEKTLRHEWKRVRRLSQYSSEYFCGIETSTDNLTSPNTEHSSTSPPSKWAKLTRHT
jgi:radical SAM superfamily enzyme YgiQ (UPF0313 family)